MGVRATSHCHCHKYPPPHTHLQHPSYWSAVSIRARDVYPLNAPGKPQSTKHHCWFNAPGPRQTPCVPSELSPPPVSGVWICFCRCETAADSCSLSASLLSAAGAAKGLSGLLSVERAGGGGRVGGGRGGGWLHFTRVHPEDIWRDEGIHQKKLRDPSLPAPRLCPNTRPQTLPLCPHTAGPRSAGGCVGQGISTCCRLPIKSANSRRSSSNDWPACCSVPPSPLRRGGPNAASIPSLFNMRHCASRPAITASLSLLCRSSSCCRVFMCGTTTKRAKEQKSPKTVLCPTLSSGGSWHGRAFSRGVREKAHIMRRFATPHPFKLLCGGGGGFRAFLQRKTPW